MTKNTLLKMDTEGYNIFINLFGNHANNNFVKYK